MSNDKVRKKVSVMDHTPAKILVIDDNPTIAALIDYALNQGGRYDVIAAYNGQEGLERMYTEQPDCVIFDVRITRGDDNHLALFLRDAVRTANMPSVILIPAPQEDQIRDLLSSADEYLVKPFRPSDLQAAIERALQRGKTEP